MTPRQTLHAWQTEHSLEDAWYYVSAPPDAQVSGPLPLADIPSTAPHVLHISHRDDPTQWIRFSPLSPTQNIPPFVPILRFSGIALMVAALPVAFVLSIHSYAIIVGFVLFCAGAVCFTVARDKHPNPDMTTCPTCSRAVSKRAESCPSCGHRLRSSEAAGCLAFIILIILGMAFLSFVFP